MIPRSNQTDSTGDKSQFAILNYKKKQSHGQQNLSSQNQTVDGSTSHETR